MNRRVVELIQDGDAVLTRVFEYTRPDEQVPGVLCLTLSDWRLWLVSVANYQLRASTRAPANLTKMTCRDVSGEGPWAWARGRGIVWAWEMRRIDSGNVEGMILEFEHLGLPQVPPEFLERTGQIQVMALGGVRTRVVVPLEV